MSDKTAVDTTQDDAFDAKTNMDESLAEFKKKSVHGAVSYMIRSLFLYGVGLLASLVLAAYLSAEAFGIYGLVTQIVSLLQFFSDVGLGPALIQKKQEPTTREYRVVFTVQQLLSWVIVAGVGLIVVSGWLQPKVGQAGIWVLLALGLSFPLSSLKVIPAIILERKLDFSRLVISTIVEQLVYNAVLVYLVVTGWGVEAYAVAVLLRAGLGVIAMYLIQSWAIGLAWDREVIRDVLSTGVKFQLSDFLARVKDQLFYLTLGWLLPLKEFGYISWSKNWSQVPYMLTVQNVIAITFPAYSRLQHDTTKLAKAIEKTLFFISLSIFPLIVGMAIFIGPVTQIVESYHKWQPAVLTFILFTLSIGWAAISTPLTNTLNAIGKINVTLKLMVMWTVLTWILTPLAVWWWGFSGVAIAASVIAVTSLVPVWIVQQEFPVDVFGSIWRQGLSALVMAICGWLTQPIWVKNMSMMFIGMICIGAVYLTMLALIARQQIRAELQSLRSR